MFRKSISGITAILLSLLFVITAFPLYAADNAPVAGFKDVTENKWYAEAVAYVAENGLMTGTSATAFEPSVTLTRAMTVQILAQIAGADLTAYTKTEFTDVPAGKWYTSAVAWASENNIASGISADTFGYKNPVTREQLALMICKFADNYKIKNRFPTTIENADGFADSDRIHDWAKEGVDWAVKCGIISGMDNNMLDPRGTATRAQAAQIFYNLDYLKANSYLPPNTADFDAIEVEDSDKVRILCWGDSLTAGGYPSYLAEMTGLVCRDYGISGETAEEIAMRQGGLPLYIQPFVIPAAKERVKVLFRDEDMKIVRGLARQAVNGFSPVTICGVKGHISYDYDDENFYFTRSDKGPYTEVAVNRLTRVVTRGMSDPKANDVHIIFSGANNYYDYDEYEELHAVQQRMIDYIGTDRYIIIGQTSLYFMPDVGKFNDSLGEIYGDHFVDILDYFLTLDAFEELGIEPTEQDLLDIEAGETPTSFRRDVDHGNSNYHTLLAKKLYEKLIELGYIE